MIRGIIFDCFGVLYGSSYEEFQRLCPSDKLDDLRDYNRQADYGFISTEDYIRSVAELIGKTEQETEDVLRQKHVRNQELIDYAYSLGGKYKLALLSNVSNDVINRLFSAEDLRHFDVVIQSSQEGIVKPNPAIFLLTAERLGLSPGECVMIDDRAENYEGAEVAGLAAVLHTSNATTVDILSKLLH